MSAIEWAYREGWNDCAAGSWRQPTLAWAHSTSAHAECVWTEDADGNWHTDCGEMFVFTTGGPVENKMRFCPYCGKALTSMGVNITPGVRG